MELRIIHKTIYIRFIERQIKCSELKMLNKKVFLELYVKTLKNWREKVSFLKELGFDELNLK